MTPPRYIRLLCGEWAETREVIPGKVFVDFDACGRVLGVELLADDFVVRAFLLGFGISA